MQSFLPEETEYGEDKEGEDKDETQEVKTEYD